ncbi:hypothetical protein ACVBEQ_06940 [Nakamurella sp. GG22]
MSDSDGVETVSRDHQPGADLSGHQRVLFREFLASAMYVALVLLAALVAVPHERLPPDGEIVRLMIGTAVGLVLAHWLAFRLAARITAEDGGWSPSAAQEAGAQLSGGFAVALFASVPFVLLDGGAAVAVSMLLLASLPAVTGVLIARLRGRSWAYALTRGAVVLVVAVGVVALKSVVGH